MKTVNLLIGILFILCLTKLLSAQEGTKQSHLTGVDFSKKFTTSDTLFKAPYVDVDEWRDAPVRHRYLHGGFRGTDARFSLYFPPKEQYQGRFFQYITPFPDNENLSQGASGEEDKIGFSITSGAYFIETNGGGRIDLARPGIANDPTIGAYRANAAAAQFSRTVAAEIFGPHRPFGYCFGGSGGAYRTVGGMENTEGVWDGAVPYVIGSPMAIPNVFTVRMHAMRILKDKFPQIIDALEPGGSGDIYAGLNSEEKEALQEVTKMGFPPQAWFGYKTMGIHGFIALYQGVVMADRKYFENDFWKVPGYLGANPPASLLKARVQQVSRIKAGISIDQAVALGLAEPLSANERGTADLAWKSMGGKEGSMPVAFQLEDQLPAVDFLGGDLMIRTGAAAGKTLQLSKIAGDKVILGPADPSVLVLIKAGDEVQVDNSNFLAVQTYHRHQVPGKEYAVWDQFRDTEGKPLYPQRPMQLGPLFTRGASGVVPTGKIKGKMIVLSSLWDREAFPWQADWYRSKVKENLGAGAGSHFRLWYTDRALHGDLSKQEDPTRTVSYLGVLQQALRDLSAWVEKGVEPPASTSYTIEDGQVRVPSSATDRKGIQPVVSLKANGKKITEVKAGEPVTFTAEAEVPPHAGKVIRAEWDFEGKGGFPVTGELKQSGKSGSKATVKIHYVFPEPGTYFPTLRITSQREGDEKTPFARIQNLDRVRVVVKPGVSFHSKTQSAGTKSKVAPIDRHALVTRHNITWNQVEGQIPLGNGEFCFNADGTGLQTFGGSTMSHWGWHSFPFPEGVNPDQIPATGTFQKGRNTGPDVFPAGTNAIRSWMYDNPHSFNFCRIRLMKAGGKELAPEDIKGLTRSYDLWSGLHISKFSIEGQTVQVVTCVNPALDEVAVKIESPMLKNGAIELAIDFPYPSLQRNKPWVGDFEHPVGNDNLLIAENTSPRRADFRRKMDEVTWFAGLGWSTGCVLELASEKQTTSWRIKANGVERLELSCAFSQQAVQPVIPDFRTCAELNVKHWPRFWKSGGAIDLSGSNDPRWKELERRIVLSQYLMAVQSAGSYPSAETGLMGIDNWRGQFHMEMVWWHLAHYALWNRWDMAGNSLEIYQRFMPAAKALAEQLGYKGLKWQKSVGPEARTAPWAGNQVLLWKQPHPVFFAELDYRLHPTRATLEKWAEIVDGTAEHMADYPVRDAKTGMYHLDPVMPPSEQGVTKDAVFDLAYWTWGLNQAQIWRERMGMQRMEQWDDIINHLAPLPVDSGVFIHSPEWRDTYTRRAWEHPDPVGVLGMLPPLPNVDRQTAHRTLLKIWETWDWKRCWGWDFPWTAMAAARLGEPGLAIDALLKEAGTKNFYDERGVCTGGPCPYLPGNGGLLYAVAMMAAGWDGASQKLAPGFPDDGSWTVRWEGLKPAP